MKRMKKLLVILIAGCMSLHAAVATAGNVPNEQEFVDFLAMLPSAPSTGEARKEVDSLTVAFGNDYAQLDIVLDWAAKYLLDDRSPIYNPQLYDSLFVMDMPGRRALDFSFADTTGRKGTLYTLEDSDTTTVFFYSADCDHCMSLLRQWHGSSAAIPESLRRKHVMAVCLNDDEPLWQQSVALLPAGWTPVRDLDGLIARRRYDLRQLPHVVKIFKGKIVR